MSKKTRKKPKQGQDDEAAAEPARSGKLGYLFGGAVGLTVLVILWGLSQKPPSPVAQELPHLTLLVEFDDLADPATRVALGELHKELIAAKLNVRGVLNYPILVPGAMNEVPTPRNIDALSAEEYARAAPYLASGGWLVPRVYAPDRKSAVFRCAPPGRGRFPRGTRRIVSDLLEKFRGRFTALWAYSFDLGLDEPEARARTNVVFGVQTANVLIRGTVEGDHPLDPATLVKLNRDMHTLQHPNLRTLTSQGAFIQYALATRAQNALGTLEPSLADAAWLRDLFERCRTKPLVDEQGHNGVIEVTTNAEGEANLDLCYWVAANLPPIKNTIYKTLRRR